MDRFAAIIILVSGTVALQVLAQAMLLWAVHRLGRRFLGATELRRTFWMSLAAIMPLIFGHLAQVGLWASFLLWRGALQTYDDAFYFSLVTFATLGYGDILLAPGFRIFGALQAACGSLMLGWSTALIFAAVTIARTPEAEREKPAGASDATGNSDRAGGD